MKNLVLETQGVQGKNKETFIKGYIQVSCENHMMQVDNFVGRGLDYKQRENPVITLSKNGESYFHGTFEELKHRLKPEN